MADRSGGMVTTNITARLVRPERSSTWQPLRQHASQFLPKRISLVLLCMDENHLNLKMMSWSSGYGVEVIGQRDLRRKRSLWKGKESVCLRCNRFFYFYSFLDKIYFFNSFAWHVTLFSELKSILPLEETKPSSILSRPDYIPRENSRSQIHWIQIRSPRSMLWITQKVDGVIRWKKCRCLPKQKWTNILQDRVRTLEIFITILCQQHFAKQRRFLKMNIFTKSWQPVMNTAFISKQNAATVTGKTTRRIS